jgi:hypothetical protein
MRMTLHTLKNSPSTYREALSGLSKERPNSLPTGLKKEFALLPFRTGKEEFKDLPRDLLYIPAGTPHHKCGGKYEIAGQTDRCG